MIIIKTKKILYTLNFSKIKTGLMNILILYLLDYFIFLNDKKKFSLINSFNNDYNMTR